jgi:hypothetical protein
MAWTNWTLLATPNEWLSASLTYMGPACYELGTGGPRGGRIREHYVGETGNEMVRLSCYGRNGSHLAEIIDDHLRRGWCLWCHSMALPSKAAAVAVQNNLLRRYRYDWNDLLNRY